MTNFYLVYDNDKVRLEAESRSQICAYFAEEDNLTEYVILDGKDIQNPKKLIELLKSDEDYRVILATQQYYQIIPFYKSDMERFFELLEKDTYQYSGEAAIDYVIELGKDLEANEQSGK